MSEAVAWLRQVIEGDKVLAETAADGSDGHWWRRMDTYVDGTSYPVGHLISDEDPYGMSEPVVYDEGRPNEAQFEHIACHDPRNAIADCEAKLGILGLYDLWAAEPADRPALGAAVCAISDAVGHLASAYKYREGYAEHWGATVSH